MEEFLLVLIYTIASGLPARKPAVSVGQPALDFTATDSEGNRFTFSSLRGSPVLLKFFRGYR